jgi:ion channel-forming bestrophin family protein
MLLNKKIPFYYIFNKVKVELFYVLLIVLLIYFVTNKFGSFLPDMPLQIPAFLGTAISILLSFQLNQSYERWWEARRLWGSIVNNSRSLVLQLQTLIDKENETSVKKIAYRQIAWCYALGQALRGQNPTENIDR